MCSRADEIALRLRGTHLENEAIQPFLAISLGEAAPTAFRKEYLESPPVLLVPRKVVEYALFALALFVL